MEKIKKKNPLLPEPILNILALKYCFQELFKKELEQPIDCINEYLLDFDTLTSNAKPLEYIFVSNKKMGFFCFSIDEILQIFYQDLSRSTIVSDHHHNVAIHTPVKNFRLPVNPYSTIPFSYQDVCEIIEQLAIKTNTMPSKYQLVYDFLSQCKELYQKCNSASKYETTRILNEFFEKKGYKFKEKYSRKTLENQSCWQMIKKKQGKNGKENYVQFLENVFLRNVGDCK